MRVRQIVLLLSVLAQIAFAQRPSTAPTQTVAERLGYPADARLLMIHADDFGMLHSVNRAIITAFDHKWITSASILVPCPWFPEVAKFAREHPEADLGIHLALNSEWTTVRWGPVASKSQVPSLLDPGYLPLIENQVVGHAKANEVEIELEAQINRAHDAGIHISHLDTHMGTLLRSPELVGIYFRVGEREGLPMLREQPATAEQGAVPATAALVDRVIQISPGVPPEKWLNTYEQMLAPLGPGVYQLTVHLGYDDDELRGATYDHPNWGAAWRQHDLDLVSSPAFQQFLREQGFVLVSWRELAKALSQEVPNTK